MVEDPFIFDGILRQLQIEVDARTDELLNSVVTELDLHKVRGHIRGLRVAIEVVEKVRDKYVRDED